MSANNKTEAGPAPPTFSLQPKLPHLPVPDLHETLDKYLKAVRPFATEAEYKQTVQFVADFARPGGIGRELQSKLIERAKTEKNSWLETWWNELAYLRYRDPVVVNVNYFYVLADDAARTTQTSRAAGMVVGLMKYRETIIKQTMPIEGGVKSPMCMSQYAYIFNSCRIPLPEMDDVKVYRPTETGTNELLVIRKNKFYTFSLVDESGSLLSESDIRRQLDAIIELDSSYSDEPPVGVLTALHRDKWADAYDLMKVSPVNKASFEAIQRAAFAVALDEVSCESINDLSKTMWHNDCKNRYFDKTVTLVVLPNGKAGFNCEHAIVDGSPTANMADQVSSIVRKTKPVETPARKLGGVRKLSFQVSGQVASIIAEAIDETARTTQNTDLYVLKINGTGKNYIKSAKLGFYKMFGRPVATYESASTRRFYHGRTEVVRSCSDASYKWCIAMQDASISLETKKKMMHDAVNSHVDYMKDATQAKGVDRHLFGLRLLATELGYPRPAIFNDPVYWRTCTWLISTSQLSSNEMTGYGWGAVHPDGYGIAYSILDDQLHYNIASFRESPHTSCIRMARAIEDAVKEIREVLGHSTNTPNQKPQSKL